MLGPVRLKIGIQLGPHVRKQFEGVGDHAVVGEQGLLFDDPVQWNNSFAVVTRYIMTAPVGFIGRTGFRPDFDGLLRHDIGCAHIGSFGLTKLGFPRVEDWNGKFELKIARVHISGIFCALLRLGDFKTTGDVKVRYEPRGFDQTMAPCQDLKVSQRYQQIDPVPQSLGGNTSLDL